MAEAGRKLARERSGSGGELGGEVLVDLVADEAIGMGRVIAWYGGWELCRWRRWWLGCWDSVHDDELVAGMKTGEGGFDGSGGDQRFAMEMVVVAVDGMPGDGFDGGQGVWEDGCRTMVGGSGGNGGGVMSCGEAKIMGGDGDDGEMAEGSGDGILPMGGLSAWVEGNVETVVGEDGNRGLMVGGWEGCGVFGGWTLGLFQGG